MKLKIIKNNEEINQKLKSYLENAYKESIFEFRIVGLVIVDNKKLKKNMMKKKVNVKIVFQKYYFIQQK